MIIALFKLFIPFSSKYLVDLLSEICISHIFSILLLLFSFFIVIFSYGEIALIFSQLILVLVLMEDHRRYIHTRCMMMVILLEILFHAIV